MRRRPSLLSDLRRARRRIVASELVPRQLRSLALGRRSRWQVGEVTRHRSDGAVRQSSWKRVPERRSSPSAARPGSDGRSGSSPCSLPPPPGSARGGWGALAVPSFFSLGAPFASFVVLLVVRSIFFSPFRIIAKLPSCSRYFGESSVMQGIRSGTVDMHAHVSQRTPSARVEVRREVNLPHAAAEGVVLWP